jgi:hypothetical protein
MRRAADALLRGDLMTAMADLSPAAFNEAMAMGASLAMLPMPTSYEVESREVSGGEHRFVVRFKTAGQDILARAAYQQLDGIWKITSISVEGLPAS